MNHLAAIAGSVGIATAIVSVARSLGHSLDPIRQPARLPRVDRSGIVVQVETAAAVPRPKHSTGAHRFAAADRSVPSDAAIAEWCETLARKVRGGESLIVALSQSQHTRLEDRRRSSSTRLLEEIAAAVVLATERGQRASTPLETYRGRSVGLDQALAVIRACLEIGGRTAFVLDRTAAGLRDRYTINAERATNSAQAKMSALVLTLLPGFALATMVIGSASIRNALLSPIGWICLPLGFGLNALGWWWMRRLVRA